jgi:hypothetical protein
MKRNVEMNGLGPILGISPGTSETAEISPGKVRVNEGDAWSVSICFYQGPV